MSNITRKDFDVVPHLTLIAEIGCMLEPVRNTRRPLLVILPHDLNLFVSLRIECVVSLGWLCFLQKVALVDESNSFHGEMFIARFFWLPV